MLTYPKINPVAIDLGLIQIHWYGLMYLFGILLAWHLAKKNQHNYAFTENQLDDLMFYISMGLVLGGRLGFMLFYQPSLLLQDPFALIRFWNITGDHYYFVGIRGMSFHGGLIGVIIMCAYLAKKTRCPFFVLTDLIASLSPIGLGLGRLGNFINGELWGRPTDLPWGMIFPRADHLARHPSQLYECFLEGCLLYLILFLYGQKSRQTGKHSALFLMSYGAVRCLAECFREPDFDQGFIALGWLTKGQALSIPMILIGIILWQYHSKIKT